MLAVAVYSFGRSRLTIKTTAAADKLTTRRNPERLRK
jgi:hypothetical protein